MSIGVLTRLSYEAAVRSLDLQERAVEQLRARTATLLVASSLTASFLGSEVLRRGAQGWHGATSVLTAAALCSLAVSICLCIYVLLPKRWCAFGLSGRELYEAMLEHAEDENELRRRLVYWIEAFWLQNQDEIELLERSYVGAAVALMVQLACWASMLVGSLS
jgi:hypothetical protein